MCSRFKYECAPFQPPLPKEPPAKTGQLAPSTQPLAQERESCPSPLPGPDAPAAMSAAKLTRSKAAGTEPAGKHATGAIKFTEAQPLRHRISGGKAYKTASDTAVPAAKTPARTAPEVQSVRVDASSDSPSLRSRETRNDEREESRTHETSHSIKQPQSATATPKPPLAPNSLINRVSFVVPRGSLPEQSRSRYQQPNSAGRSGQQRLEQSHRRPGLRQHVGHSPQERLYAPRPQTPPLRYHGNVDLKSVTEINENLIRSIIVRWNPVWFDEYGECFSGQDNFSQVSDK